MNLAESIMFSAAGSILLMIIAASWLIFRRKKKIALIITAVIAISYIGYYMYYPTGQKNMHAKRYDQLTAYLAETYPGDAFTVRPKQYEKGIQAGEFTVNRKETPEIGVTLHVDKAGTVKQTNYFTAGGILPQDELWKDLILYGNEWYTLDTELPEVVKKDSWTDGGLTVFAVTIGGKPVIALYTYSKEASGLLKAEEGEENGAAAVEYDGRLFVYADEAYEGSTVTVKLSSGFEKAVSVADRKGQLITETAE